MAVYLWLYCPLWANQCLEVGCPLQILNNSIWSKVGWVSFGKTLLKWVLRLQYEMTSDEVWLCTFGYIACYGQTNVLKSIVFKSNKKVITVCFINEWVGCPLQIFNNSIWPKSGLSEFWINTLQMGFEIAVWSGLWWSMAVYLHLYLPLWANQRLQVQCL